MAILVISNQQEATTARRLRWKRQRWPLTLGLVLCLLVAGHTGGRWWCGARQIFVAGHSQRAPPAPHLQPANGQICLASKRLAVLGDSQALRLSNTLASYLGCTSVVKAGERCGEGPNYLGIAQRPAGQLVQPSAREGPTAHGLEHLPLGCRDCSGCDSSLRRCTAAETLEYIAVEFARDVSIQGPNFTTTQENIVLGYLAHAPPDVVVLNAGLHDTSLQDSSPEAYEANMRWYLGLFDALVPRPRLLVLGTTRVDRDKQPAEHREVTSNQRIHAYNSRAAALAAERGDMWLDPYHLLQLPLWQARNVDGAHYADQYYEVMAWDVLGMLCRAALTWPAGSPPPAPP